MPRLQFEPSLSAADLFVRPRAEVVPDARWWVMHTKPRAEKALARRLSSLGRDFFLPLYPSRALRRGRVLTSYMPLFPGYLFIHGNEEHRLDALKTNFVVQCLAVSDQHQLHEDLQNVHRLMSVGQGLTPEERIVPGTSVEIIHGALQGMEGRVIRREKQLRFLVEVRLLQRGVSVELESWMFTPN
jgi:transcription termination/antitermination protein NusG